MMRRVLSVAMGMIVVGAVPALAGGDSYKARDKSSFYAGGIVSYGWGRLSADGDKAKTRGVMGGGVVGYRVVTGSGSLAVEADLLGGGIKRDEVETEILSNGTTERDESRYGTDLLASLRVKGAWGQGDFRPYLTGGVAWQRFEAKYNYQDTSAAGTERGAGSIKDDQFGFTVGTGVDWQVGSAYSVSLGYHYYRFKDDIQGADVDIATNLHTIRLSGKLHY